MRKFLALLLILTLCLTGCSSKTETTAHSYEDLTIQIPVDYIELTGEEFAEGLDFVFGCDPIAVNGLREEKATFEAYGLELDLQSYGNLLCKANNVQGKLQQTEGIWNFSYEAGEFTYVVTLWETDDAFWTVQAYCPTENYSTAKDDMWEILSSVTV